MFKYCISREKGDQYMHQLKDEFDAKAKGLIDSAVKKTAEGLLVEGASGPGGVRERVKALKWNKQTLHHQTLKIHDSRLRVDGVVSVLYNTGAEDVFDVDMEVSIILDGHARSKVRVYGKMINSLQRGYKYFVDLNLKGG